MENILVLHAENSIHVLCKLPVFRSTATYAYRRIYLGGQMLRVQNILYLHTQEHSHR